MRPLLLLLLWLLAVLRLGQSKRSSDNKKESDGGGKERLAVIVNKVAQGGLVTLSDGNFSKFVVERPREYHAVLLFTATGAKYQCSVCVATKRIFSEAAAYYKEQYDFNTTSAENRVAFFVLEVDSARNTFNDMGLETVPRLYALPPTKHDSPKMRMGEYEIEVRSLMEGAGAFLGDVESRTGVKVKVTVNPLPIMTALCLIAYFLALLAASAASEPQKAIFWFRNRWIWSVFSLLCFGVGVSGSIFCIIRGAPLYGGGRKGVRIFAGQGRDQYLVEGIIIALMTVGCGLAGMLLVYGTKLRLPLGIGAVLRHVIVLAALSAFAVLCMEIGEAYIDKTRWYQVKETVDPKVWEWLTSGVKKHSGIFKRAVRLSELWLFEFKTWEAFGKKFKSLLVDYVQRLVVGALRMGSATSKP